MSNKFDELTKNLAQSVTRRAALKKFGVGLVGMTLACFGFANKAKAAADLCQSCIKTCRAGGGSTQYCHDYCADFCHPKGVM